MKKRIDLPFILTCPDYHDFDTAGRYMRMINPEIRVVEIDSDLIEELREESKKTSTALMGSYFALVFTGKKPTKKEIMDILKSPNTVWIVD